MLSCIPILTFQAPCGHFTVLILRSVLSDLSKCERAFNFRSTNWFKLKVCYLLKNFSKYINGLISTKNYIIRFCVRMWGVEESYHTKLNEARSYMAKTWYSIFQSKTRTCVFLNGQNREAPRLDSSPMTKTRKGPRLDSSPMTKTRKGPRLDSSPMAKTRKRPLQGQVQYFTKTWSQAPVLNRNELWPTESQDFLLEDFKQLN